MAYDINQKPDETLEKYYRRLAKTADQRLVRLEQLNAAADAEISRKLKKGEKRSEAQYYKTAELWAYRRAQIDIRKWNKYVEPNKFRFNTKPPKDQENLLAKINDIKTFLSMPTSTKSGITEVYQKRVDKFNKKYGTNFTWPQLAKYYEKGIDKKWLDKFGSKTALKVIGVLQANADKLKKRIAETDIKNIDVPDDDDVLREQTEKALKSSGLHIKELL